MTYLITDRALVLEPPGLGPVHPLLVLPEVHQLVEGFPTGLALEGRLARVREQVSGEELLLQEGHAANAAHEPLLA